MTEYIFNEFDKTCMQRALQLAHIAAVNNEVPVGALIVNNQDMQIIGEGYNQPIGKRDPTAHAEIIAIRQAAQKINNYRLVNTTMYVTLEPCPMCIGALLHARINKLIFATQDLRTGAVRSAINLLGSHKWNHSIECQQGLLAVECSEILRDFFKARR